jgi:hypothetical protein
MRHDFAGQRHGMYGCERICNKIYGKTIAVRLLWYVRYVRFV